MRLITGSCFRAITENAEALQAGDYLEFDEVIAHARARAELDPVTDFVAKGIQGIGGTQAVTAALRVFATCDVAAVGALFYCGFELHATVTLSLDVYAVNDADDDGAERGVGVADDLASP